jgi:hypothetical protein
MILDVYPLVELEFREGIIVRRPEIKSGTGGVA